MDVRSVGEDGWIRRIRERFAKSPARLGIGDDAAVVDIPAGSSVVACSDLVVENTHFLRNLHPPDSVGYKAVAVNVSDVGAMAGVPLYFMISMSAPPDLDWSWVEGFYNGVEVACSKFGVALIGGDTSSSDRIFVDVSMIGHAPGGRVVCRSGARPGEGIYLTGTLGGSSLGLELLQQGESLDHPAVHRHLYPEPRHRVGRALIAKATAMIDISDGLSTDLGHLVEESTVSARIFRNMLPVFNGATDRQVLHGGEEYELLFTGMSLPASMDGIPVTRIGEIFAAAGAPQVVLVDRTSESVLTPSGWQHFER